MQALMEVAIMVIIIVVMVVAAEAAFPPPDSRDYHQPDNSWRRAV